MKKEIIINHLSQEIRVAIMEQGRLTEIYHERLQEASVVGNIYKGKVLTVLRGMDAAFVDIGLPKAAFLYVHDIRIDSPEEDSPEEDKDLEKNITIQELLKEGQEILVQVTKSPISTKGARVNCNISIPGRNLVLIPHTNGVSVSKQINHLPERNRVHSIVMKNKPEDVGFIIRTVAHSRQEDEFIADIHYLHESWKKIEKKFNSTPAPSLLFEEVNLTYRTLRDTLSSEISAIYIDNKKEFAELKIYLQKYLPKFVAKIKLYEQNEDIFNYYGVNIELDRALGRKVYLESGGHLIIDQSEALTAIDVNTGSYTGKESHEDTVLKTNVEAAKELAHQVRLRDIGGIIIIDFIDMVKLENRDNVYKVLKKELKKDKSRNKILAISEIGLVEMTRKRSQENLNRYLCSICPYCDGNARIKSLITIAYDIFRDLDRLYKMQSNPRTLLVTMHPDVYEYIENESANTLNEIEDEFNTSVIIQKNSRLHHEQYEILELEKSNR